MYLSRLILNQKSRAVRHDLANLQGLHRTMMAAFPSAADASAARAEMGLLFRVELPPWSPDVRLIVQSAIKPDWSVLESDYLEDRPENPAIKPVGEVYEGIADGARLRFRLRANVTKKVDTKSGPDGARRNGKRVPLRDPDAALKWLERKAVDAGFKLAGTVQRPEACDVSAIEMPGGRSVGIRDGARVTIDSVLFEGQLVVVDRVLFLRALKSGIGPAKAYGCGLLSIARP